MKKGSLQKKYAINVFFNNQAIVIATPTSLKDFMTGMGYGDVNLPVKINNRLFFPYQWSEKVLKDRDRLMIQFPER